MATAAGTGAPQVAALVRETGDLGQAAERLLALPGSEGVGLAASLEVTEVVRTLREIAVAEGAGSQGRKLELLAGLLARATPLEARYLLLRLGIGTPTILDALAQVHAGGKAARPVLERGYNICCDLGKVAATLVSGGLAAVEQLRVQPGNPVRVMLAAYDADADRFRAVTKWGAGFSDADLAALPARLPGRLGPDPGRRRAGHALSPVHRALAELFLTARPAS